MKPLRTVIRWQVLATAVMTLLGGYLAGSHGAMSAALGGLVPVVGAVAYVLILALHRGSSPGGTVVAALRAEGVKVFLMVVLLWTVLKIYKDAVVVGVIGAFAVSVVIFTTAIFVRDE